MTFRMRLHSQSGSDRVEGCPCIGSVDAPPHSAAETDIDLRPDGNSACRPDKPPASRGAPAFRQLVEILNGLGLHMRSAASFVELAAKFRSEIRVFRDGREFNGRSIL